MSLVKSPNMTDAKIAANQANGEKSLEDRPRPKGWTGYG